MGSMTIKGTDEVSAMLESLGAHAQDIAGRVLYEGAGVVVQAVASAVAGIPVHEEGEYGGIRAEYKAGLEESLGIAPHRYSGGTTDTVIGFDGYNSKGVANSLVARSVEKGTSWHPAYPVIRQAGRAAKGAAVAKMTETAKEEIAKYTK